MGGRKVTGIRALVALAGVLTLSGCGSRPAGSSVPSPGPGPDAGDSAASTEGPPLALSAGFRQLLAAPAGSYESQSQSLQLVLPGRADWTTTSERSWTELTHPPSGIELWLTHPLSRRHVSAQECEQRLQKAFPGNQGASHQRHLQERRESSLASGYRGVEQLTLQPDGRLTALGVFAGPGRCLAIGFRAPKNDEFELKLQLFLSEILPTLRPLEVESRLSASRF